MLVYPFLQMESLNGVQQRISNSPSVPEILGVVGTGGFAKEVAFQLKANTDFLSRQFPLSRILFVKHDSISLSSFAGFETVDETSFLNAKNISKFHLIAIGDPKKRKDLHLKYESFGSKSFSFFSDRSLISPDSLIGDGAIICPNVVIMPNVVIGKEFQAHINSYIAHDCVIGNFVTISPGVLCNGNVQIQDEVFIGAGAIIKNGTADSPTVIGRGSKIGMGAVVTKSVKSGTTVIGIPAKERLQGSL